jgi:hypothetical protein
MQNLKKKSLGFLLDWKDVGITKLEAWKEILRRLKRSKKNK